MRISPKHASRPALLLCGLLLLAGCSRSLLTAPGAPTTSAPAPQAIASAPAPPSLLGNVLPVVGNILNWTLVTQTLVHKDQVTVVTGHRWSIEFEKGSLVNDALITIQDYDPNILDVQFGPHGTQFPVPVTVTVDFANTAADPGAAQYDGSAPVLYWLDDQTNTWVEIPSQTDWANKKLIARLPHFSRYAVGGKAGWKQSTQREDD